VTAAPDLIPPPLIQQLKAGGKLVIPAGLPEAQTLILVEKSINGGVTTKKILPVRFSQLEGTEAALKKLCFLDPMEEWPPVWMATILNRAVEAVSPRRRPAAGLQTQGQSLARLVTEEPSLADLHAGMSEARSGHPEIPAHRDGWRSFPC